MVGEDPEATVQGLDDGIPAAVPEAEETARDLPETVAQDDVPAAMPEVDEQNAQDDEWLEMPKNRARRKSASQRKERVSALNTFSRRSRRL